MRKKKKKNGRLKLFVMLGTIIAIVMVSTANHFVYKQVKKTWFLKGYEVGYYLGKAGMPTIDTPGSNNSL